MTVRMCPRARLAKGGKGVPAWSKPDFLRGQFPSEDRNSTVGLFQPRAGS